MPYLGKTPSQATRQRYYLTASGGETSISGTMTTGGTLTFNDGEFVDVKLNGVSLVAGTDYNTTTANTIGGLSALAANDQVEIVVYDTFSVFGGNVDGDFTINNGTLTAGTTSLDGAVTINESSADVDFRVESNGNANMLFVDASADKIGVGTNSPSESIHCTGAVMSTGVATTAVASSATVDFTSGEMRLITRGADTSTRGGLKVVSQASNGGSSLDPLVIDTSGNATFSGVVKVSDGSESAPAIVFSDDTNTGIYSSAADKICFSTGGTERMRVTDTGRIEFEVPTNQTGSLQDQRLDWRNENNAGIMASIGVVREADGNAPGALVFRTSTNVDSASNSSDGEISEKMRVASNGEVLIGKTSATFSTPGFHFNADPDQLSITTNQNTSLRLNRVNNDGAMISFQGDSSEEGTISISGGTISYNGGHLSRWSRLVDGSKPSTILKGTVMSNLDDMIVWSHEAQAATYYERGDDLMITPDICYKEGDTIPDGKEVGDLKTAAVYASIGDEKTPAVDAYNEDNEQLNHTKVSDAEGDINVAGVFVAWDEADNYNDFYLAMTGDMVIRIAQGTTVARGDLLMSAGDGTAKPQGDDIVRSKTIAKVTSTTKSHTYDDGTYLVPCVLMAC